MEQFKNKVAVITGSASGVGRAMAFAFAEEGMKIVLADISDEALKDTKEALENNGHQNVLAVKTDVTNFDSVAALAQKSFEAFGNVHVLCNNAGVGLGEAKTPIWDLAVKDWEWGYAVNTMGVVYGVKAFLPQMIVNGEEGFILNTSSNNGGITSLATTPIYASSKAAVTSFTEVLHYQLLKAGSKIKAGLLFPGPHLVNTNILNSARSRPNRFGASADQKATYVSMEALAKNAGVEFKLTEPEEVASYAVKGIRQGLFWQLPDNPKQDRKLKARTESILNRENPTLPE